MLILLLVMRAGVIYSGKHGEVGKQRKPCVVFNDLTIPIAAIRSLTYALGTHEGVLPSKYSG